MKYLAVLGSTGSIGQNTLEVVRNLNKNGFPVSPRYLSANSNIDVLRKQIEEFRPASVVIADENCYKEFSRNLNFDCEILCGREGLTEILRRDDYDLLVNSLVGFSGLIPTVEAIKNGKDVALANKESLVAAGEIIRELIAGITGNKPKILPIDSEHSAIFQCIQGEQFSSISKLTLTASGGPFLNYTKDSFENISQEEALNHPNWKMGNKITIDSATLMNKGFEIIEAKWLFSIDVRKIEIVIHPQSIVHSLVEFTDGSVKAQLGIPDMKIPIQYAITFPQRVSSSYQRLDLTTLGELTFMEPDLEKFECLKLAYDVIKLGGLYPVVLNAANEIAVEMFLSSTIKFNEIPVIIKSALDNFKDNGILNLETIVETDRRTRDYLVNLLSFPRKRETIFY
jgi:1-deoxy-D-xylulose-5-phosphate reductoisomerase